MFQCVCVVYGLVFENVCILVLMCVCMSVYVLCVCVCICMYVSANEDICFSAAYLNLSQQKFLGIMRKEALN